MLKSDTHSERILEYDIYVKMPLKEAHLLGYLSESYDNVMNIRHAGVDDGTVKVIVNKNLSEPARAEMYSHEGNGHAYIYMMKGGAKARERASHQPVNFKETNTELRQRIIRSKKETIQNMRQK